jgi:hypothetical protein
MPQVEFTDRIESGEPPMPRTANLNTAIKKIIAAEVKAALLPIEKSIARLAKAAGAGRRGPGRPPKTAGKKTAAPVRHRRRWGAAAKAATRAAAKLNVGQKVSFNVGRGTFEGKVVSIDAKKGRVVVARTTDGKKLKRPAAKVKAA